MLRGLGPPHEMGAQFNQSLGRLGQSMSALGRGPGSCQIPFEKIGAKSS